MDWRLEAIEKLQGYAQQLEVLEKQTAPPDELEQARLWVQTVDRGLSLIEPDSRLVLEQLYIYPCKGRVSQLCAVLDVYPAAIYRKRDKALEVFTISQYGMLHT